MKLHYREYGEYAEHKPTLIFLHGLFGSSSNWHGISRQLENQYHIIAPDLRNHGRSPHHEAVEYPSMAEDLFNLVDDHGLESIILIGHSMGGKVAMWFTLHYPELVERLVVVDIAPVAYDHSFDLIIEALHAVDLPKLSSRGEADGVLSGYLDELGLRQYLLQNLARKDDDWHWRINLKGLQAGMGNLVGYPEVNPTEYFPGEALFIHGSLSNYVRPEYEAEIKAYFPQARLQSVPDAGHWVYAEKPEGFMAALIPFLSH